MSGDPGSGPAAGIERIVDGAADELVLVIEAGIDLVQTARLGRAFPETRPIVEPLARRAPLAPPGAVPHTPPRHGRRPPAQRSAPAISPRGGPPAAAHA